MEPAYNDMPGPWDSGDYFRICYEEKLDYEFELVAGDAHEKVKDPIIFYPHTNRILRVTIDKSGSIRFHRGIRI